MSKVHSINTKIKDKQGRPQQPALTGQGHQPDAVVVRPVIGISEWFRPGEHGRVEKVLADCKVLGITELRTGISWAEWQTAEGMEWYLWLLQRLAGDVSVLPCVTATPPSLGLVPRTSAPPREPSIFAGFIDDVISRAGKYFDWIELWNEPNRLSNWDWRLDPEWLIFSDMITGAAYRAKDSNKKTVLCGMCPTDLRWLRLMCERGVLSYIDAVGIHGYPGTWEFDWEEWGAKIVEVRDLLDIFSLRRELWITGTGYSTWQHSEAGQARCFLKAIAAPVSRMYWSSLHDLDRETAVPDDIRADERNYHLGLKYADGRPKLLFRLWESGGIEAVQEVMKRATKPAQRQKPTLIIGGAGFIGTNLAHHLLKNEQQVVIFDNLSRPGVEQNLRWLQETYGDMVQAEIADIGDSTSLRREVQRAKQVFHLAAQVAVTTSIANPAHDFAVNVRGTINLLEALRSLNDPPPLVFTSTNKVYGSLQDVYLRRYGDRYEPIDFLTRLSGISERCMIDFYSPYGCSKGAADQYVLDYARTFNIPATVFRMSCIYGPHQMGTEDQGWIAHFLISAISGRPITIYGDGMQVRDVLYVDDLVNAFLLAQEHIKALSGQAFNIGGGPANTLSLLELIDLIEVLHDVRPDIHFGEWRHGDQRYYVSDSRRFKAMTGWSPRVGVREGVGKLYEWLVMYRSRSARRVVNEEIYDEVLAD
ncbi:MAG: NAD-dependent epimerase/dehydratase family protein [Nitrospirota bacterium]